MRLPKWLTKMKVKYPILYFDFWLFIGLIVFSILHFFSFRNDIVYGSIMIVFPFISMVFGSIYNFKLPKIKPKLNPDIFLLQGFPVLISQIIMPLNILMMIYSKGVFNQSAYDEFYFLILIFFIETIFFVLLRFLSGKLKPYFAILLYILTEIFAIIMYILALTIV